MTALLQLFVNINKIICNFNILEQKQIRLVFFYISLNFFDFWKAILENDTSKWIKANESFSVLITFSITWIKINIQQQQQQKKQNHYLFFTRAKIYVHQKECSLKKWWREDRLPCWANQSWSTESWKWSWWIKVIMPSLQQPYGIQNSFINRICYTDFQKKKK